MSSTNKLTIFKNQITIANKQADILADFLEDLYPRFKKKRAINTIVKIEEYEAILEAYTALSNSIKAMEDIQNGL